MLDFIVVGPLASWRLSLSFLWARYNKGNDNLSFAATVAVDALRRLEEGGSTSRTRKDVCDDVYVDEHDGVVSCNL